MKQEFILFKSKAKIPGQPSIKVTSQVALLDLQDILADKMYIMNISKNETYDYYLVYPDDDTLKTFLQEFKTTNKFKTLSIVKNLTDNILKDVDIAYISCSSPSTVIYKKDDISKESKVKLDKNTEILEESKVKLEEKTVVLKKREDMLLDMQVMLEKKQSELDEKEVALQEKESSLAKQELFLYSKMMELEKKSFDLYEKYEGLCE